MSKIISFPHMGDYYIPIKYLFSHITKIQILIAPPITNKTIELGSKYSPDFVCTPFKYTLGNYIEGLDKGANILLQAGGGCRYGYYSELQDKILQDLGYDFELYNFVSKGKTDMVKIYKLIKKIDPKIKLFKSIYHLLITIKMVKYMDKIDDFIRQNIGFETEENIFLRTKRKMLKEFSESKSYIDLLLKYKKYTKEFKNIHINKPSDCLRVGVIGELYTLMEPFSNYYLETELAKFNIEVKRYTNVHYLLFEKSNKVKKYLKTTKYIKYRMGADAADNIARTKYLCENNYDGIIHIKSSFCTPEIGAMPIINKICKEYNTPVIFLSFDTSTSEVGIKTRIEAFYDMIEMRKKNEELLHRN